MKTPDVQFEDLVSRHLDGRLTQDEETRLRELLHHDVTARGRFVELTDLHAMLTGDASLAGEALAERDRVAAKNIVHPNWHRRWIPIAAAACVMIGVAAWMMGRGPAWATVVEAGPGVEVVRGGRTWPARAGDVLRTGDSIRVSGIGAARLAVKGLGSAVIGPEAHLQRAAEARVLELQSGFIEIEAEKQPADRPWRIRTTEAEMAVIGTKFTIAAAEGRTALRVREGMVRLTSLQTGQAQGVRGGNRAFVTSHAPPVVAGSRPGSVLLLTSRVAPDAGWDRFNQLVGDKLVTARLWRLGFKVETRHYDEVQPDDLRDRALVVVSLFDFGVGEPALERLRLAESDVPVICLEPAGFPSLGMTSGFVDGGLGFEKIELPVIVSMPAHPLAGGLRGSQTGWLRKVAAWGHPAYSAQIIAHLPGYENRAVLFAYDRAQRLAAATGGSAKLAPARRTGLFLDPYAMTDRSNAIWQVFEAAVDWSVSVEGAK